MRLIIKGREPQVFTDWKDLANDDWQPTYADLGGLEKRAVKNALDNEQGGICCYCERRLIDADSHIEHCKPQHLNEVDALDFSNLLCSCQQVTKKGEPRHCGNLKGDWYDDGLFVSPLQADCSSHFVFSADGSVRASDESHKPAIETIDRLGLNIPKLQDLRKNTLEPFLDDVLTDEELGRFIAGYLRVGEAGKLPEFITAIENVFSEWVVS